MKVSYRSIRAVSGESSEWRAPRARIDAAPRGRAGCAGEGVKLHEAKSIITTALRLVHNCQESYRKASPETRKLWNEAFLKRVYITDRRVASYDLAPPFSALVSGSNKRLLVEVNGRRWNRDLPLFDLIRAHMAS